MGRGYLLGKQLMPQDIAKLCHAQGWRDLDLVIAVATCLSESGGYDEAYHDNTKELKDLSKLTFGYPYDSVVGKITGKPFYVINGAKGLIKPKGSMNWAKLSPDSEVLWSRDIGLFQINMMAKYIGTKTESNLYIHENNLKAAWALFVARNFQPWYGYTNHIATNPAMKGQYIQKAVKGIANYYATEFGILPNPLLDFAVSPK